MWCSHILFPASPFLFLQWSSVVLFLHSEIGEFQEVLSAPYSSISLEFSVWHCVVFWIFFKIWHLLQCFCTKIFLILIGLVRPWNWDERLMLISDFSALCSWVIGMNKVEGRAFLSRNKNVKCTLFWSMWLCNTDMFIVLDFLTFPSLLPAYRRVL